MFGGPEENYYKFFNYFLKDFHDNYLRILLAPWENLRKKLGSIFLPFKDDKSDFLMYFSRSPSVWICLKYIGDWNTKFCGQLPQTFYFFWRIPFRIVIIFLIISWGDSYRILIISWEDLIGKLAFFWTCEDNKTDFLNFFSRSPCFGFCLGVLRDNQHDFWLIPVNGYRCGLFMTFWSSLEDI